jgi:hypothetical protein
MDMMRSTVVRLVFLLVPGILAAQTQAGAPRDSRLRTENDSLRRVISDLQARLGVRDSSAPVSPRVATLVDQVVVRMERVEREPKSFFRARTKAELDEEEKRLVTLAQEQATEARSLVAELRGLKYAQADSLDGLVRGAASDYSAYVGILRLSLEFANNTGKNDAETDAKLVEYRLAFAAKVNAIRQLKRATTSP